MFHVFISFNLKSIEKSIEQSIEQSISQSINKNASGCNAMQVTDLVPNIVIPWPCIVIVGGWLGQQYSYSIVPSHQAFATVGTKFIVLWSQCWPTYIQ